MSYSKVLCMDGIDLMKHLADNKVNVDLIYTDPPYLIEKISGGGSVNNVKKLNQSLQSLEDNDMIDSYNIETFAEQVCRLQKDINIYFWCNKKQIPLYSDIYINQLKCKFDILFWGKTNPLPTYSNKYLTDVEYCLYFRKGGSHCKPECYQDAFTYYIEPINAKDKKLWEHPTIKPLECVKRHIRNSSKPGELVLDPFLGSGTTGVACKELNRNFIGCDINERWANIANKRINNLGE